MIEKYAELLVKKGVNLQSDQVLLIDAAIEQAPLVEELTRQAYQIGAKDVVVNYHDEVVDKLRYQNNPVSYFKQVPDYLAALRKQSTVDKAAFISLTGDDPEGMMDVDATKVSTWSKAIHSSCHEFYDAMDLGMMRWCIAGWPTKKWADKVYGARDDSCALLEKAIMEMTYCDKDDPLKSWENHRQSFEKRINYLNNLDIKELHYHNSLGTDLIVGLNKDYLFAGGGQYDRAGIYFFPNIPTQEIFTTPSINHVEGIVYNSLPLYYNGHVVDDFYVVFKQGRVSDYHAGIGEDCLRNIIETDEGSHHLGEIALVGYDSPISNMKRLFYNTLYDENASCHIALGKGFGECVKDGLTMDKQQLYEKGINDSFIHIDFMIGTSDMEIEAILNNDQKVTIFENGNWK